jgi:uncharacterized coiled-coil protein SlyX
MVITGQQFNDAMVEINESYAKQTAKINALVERVAALEEAAKPKQTAAQKKAAEKKAAEELAKLGDIADR